jgi:hypothetical protein
MKNNFKTIYLIIFFFLSSILALTISINFKNYNKKHTDIAEQQKIVVEKKNQEKQIPVDPYSPKSLSRYKDDQTVFIVQGTIEDLLYKKKAMRCEMYTKDGDTGIKGVIYTDGKSLKSTLTTSANNIITENNTLITGKYMYTWNTGAVYGVALTMVAADESSDTIKKNTTKTNINYKYTCNGWVVIPSYFWKPSAIDFIDITGSLSQIKQNPCLVCKTLTEPKSIEDCNAKFSCQ